MPDAHLPARSPVTTLEWAEFYASLGWSVVPVRPREKLPCPDNGWARYQTTPATAAERHNWFAIGGLGIGLVQGATAGTITLDFDGEAGMETLARLEAEHGPLPHSPAQLTPSGGRHVVLAHPGRPVPTRKNLLPGFDVRGDGGFIVAHPSIHPSGNQYHWDVDAHPEEAAVAPCPAWVSDLICGEVAGVQGAGATVVRLPSAGPLGLPQDRIADGRETYMRDTVLAVARELRDRLGRLPTEAELFEAAWPQYARRADLSRPGRGEGEFRAKVRYTLGRAARGVLPGLTAAAGMPATEQDQGVVGQQPGNSGELAKPASFKTLGIAEVLALAPPEYRVGGLLTTDGMAVCYAPWGSFKTFVSLSLALSVAYGVPWLGRPVKQCTVLYCAAEGARGLGKRIRAWQRKNGLEGVDAPFRVLTATVRMVDTVEVEKLVETVREVVRLEGGAVGMTVIDTVARAMVGAEENSAEDMGLFVAGCGRVQEVSGGLVLGIHHAGKDKERGMKGSVALPGACDTILRLDREDDKGLGVVLTVEKQKDDEEGEPLRLRMAVEEWADGLVPVSSLVVAEEAAATDQPASAAPAPPAVVSRSATKLSDNARIGQRMLVRALSKYGATVTGSLHVPPNEPTVSLEQWRAEFMNGCGENNPATARSYFKRAREELVSKGVVAVYGEHVWRVS